MEIAEIPDGRETVVGCIDKRDVPSVVLFLMEIVSIGIASVLYFLVL